MSEPPGEDSPRPEPAGRAVALEVFALGLIQGAAELVPVSSSAHVAAVPWLLGWEVASWEPARRKELEVALHTGAALALAPELLRLLPDPKTLALSLAPPVVVGYWLEGPIEERLGGPMGLAVGLVGGGAALAVGDRWGLRRAEAGARRTGARRTGAPSAVAFALGLAQAAALVPGVSRSGATLAAARTVGYSREEASRLSFGVGGPVLVGATVLKAWRGRESTDWKLMGMGAGAAFAGTRVALKTIGLERRRPLWPYAAERALLAAAILGLRYRRSR